MVTQKMRLASALCHELPPNEEKMIVSSKLYLFTMSPIPSLRFTILLEELQSVAQRQGWTSNTLSTLYLEIMARLIA
jgi:hypothetical protein